MVLSCPAVSWRRVFCQFNVAQAQAGTNWRLAAGWPVPAALRQGVSVGVTQHQLLPPRISSVQSTGGYVQQAKRTVKFKFAVVVMTSIPEFKERHCLTSDHAVNQEKKYHRVPSFNSFQI